METKKRTRKPKNKLTEILSIEPSTENIIENTTENIIEETTTITNNEIDYSYLDTFKNNINAIILSLETSIKQSNNSILINSINNNQTIDNLNKKLKNIQDLHKKEILDIKDSSTNSINNLNSEKNLLICENIKLKDRIVILEKVNKQIQEETELSTAKNNNLKSQFETYKLESTNTYTNLKTLYDELKNENNVFVNRLEKITKEYDNIKNEHKKLKDEYNERLESEIQSFKNVSLLNTYLKEIDSLKKEISILNQKLTTNKKFLEQSQKENKDLSSKLETLSVPEQEESVEEQENTVEEQEETLEEQEESVEEQENTVEEQEETVEEQEEVVEEQEETTEEKEETTEEQEEVVEIDISKFDIIEVDDKEYYVDLDNNIYDKDSLDVVGKLTDDGDAIFFE